MSLSIRTLKNKFQKTTKQLLLLSNLVLFLICTTSCGEAKQTSNDLKEITLCLDWTPNTNHTGFYVADALGYYEEAGISISIVQPPQNGAAQCCAMGQAEFAIDAQDTLAAAFDMDAPLPVTAVGAILQHNTSCIMSRAGEGLDTPKGLENKQYSTWDSPIELAMIKHVMEKDGGNFDKVTLIPNTITNEPLALQEKQTDAVWVFYGWSGVNAELAGVECDYWYFKDISSELDYYTPIIIGNNTFLNENPEISKAFMEATRKGYEYAAKNPKEAAKMLLEGDTTGALKANQELVYKSQEWISTQYLDEQGYWGAIDEDRWNTFYKWLYTNGLTSKDLTGTGFSRAYLTVESK